MIAKMIAKLSKRERVMIYALALLLLIAGSFFLLIKPMVAKNDKAADNVAALQEERNILQARLNELPGLIRDAAAYGKDLENNKFTLYSWQGTAAPAALDVDLTKDLLLKHGLHIVSTTYGNPAWVDLPEVYSPGANPPGSVWQIRAVNVKVSCSGSMNAFLALADDCGKLDWISLTSVSIYSYSGDVLDGFYLEFTVYLSDPLRKR